MEILFASVLPPRYLHVPPNCSSSCCPRRLLVSFSIAQSAKFLRPHRYHDGPIPMFNCVAASLRGALLCLAAMREDLTHLPAKIVDARFGPSMPRDEFVVARRRHDSFH